MYAYFHSPAFRSPPCQGFNFLALRGRAVFYRLREPDCEVEGRVFCPPELPEDDVADLEEPELVPEDVAGRDTLGVEVLVGTVTLDRCGAGALCAGAGRSTLGWATVVRRSVLCCSESL